MNPDEQAIADVLHRYGDALNASSTDAVMPLYAPEAIFMPQNSPSAIGTAAVRAAYDAVFAAITLSVTFHVEEVKPAPEWAFARTNSAGTATVNSTGEHSAEANQELFLFQKIEGAWRIARYCFSTTNPPRA